MKFTKSEIDKLAATERDQLFWDDGLSGFGLKVTPTGRKIFICQKRVGGKPKRYTIGEFGRPWILDQARGEALRILQVLSIGGDPNALLQSSAGELTLAKVADRYWASAISHKKATTVANEKGLLDWHILPLLGKRSLAQLTREDVQKFVADIAAGKTRRDVRTKARGRAIVTGGRSSANRSLALLSSMLSFAVDNRMCRENVAAGVKQFALPKHNRFLTDDEIHQVGSALRELELEGVSFFGLAAIKFLILTGCRKNEALAMEWHWVDLRSQVINLPDSKTGQKPLMIGYSAVELLKKVQLHSGTKFVFANPGATSPISISKIWAKVKQRAGIERLRLHDLRHNFASSAVAGGQSLFLVGKLLGHSQSSTTERYAHLSRTPIQAAADDVAAKLNAILSAVEPRV
ncbi:site-specific integrase [Neorhizobium galegae]|uniref:tyrosine-type recombinase/integrase n=1 Tax=Neorhizobium galegae TaxID=399 RepID=UPI0021015313|nr:site-specific integrase [Neorhizobium galegae]MCQ1573491.1 site-specific integrase [Neorhizobium galegae]